jgi:hypothetical protein
MQHILSRQSSPGHVSQLMPRVTIVDSRLHDGGVRAHPRQIKRKTFERRELRHYRRPCPATSTVSSPIVYARHISSGSTATYSRSDANDSTPGPGSPPRNCGQIARFLSPPAPTTKLSLDGGRMRIMLAGLSIDCPAKLHTYRSLSKQNA